jgi:hypothetical protein
VIEVQWRYSLSTMSGSRWESATKATASTRRL